MLAPMWVYVCACVSVCACVTVRLCVQLLQGISGYALPGRLCALMGASGAGACACVRVRVRLCGQV